MDITESLLNKRNRRAIVCTVGKTTVSPEVDISGCYAYMHNFSLILLVSFAFLTSFTLYVGLIYRFINDLWFA